MSVYDAVSTELLKLRIDTRTDQMTPSEVKAFNAGRSISFALPSRVTVLIYKSSQHDGWNTHAMLDAVDVVTGEPGSFGAIYQHPSEPTPREIAEHVIEQLRHEVEEQLGLDPHGRTER